ncbi:Acetylornithine aminotransferase [Thalassoglobus neptunius]|uniref:Acetylornithine aminotransferase n=1 Tax=Thalassoglobus neptunius TaxID=1938619 RepID=A0A5C5X494_9PLAN|nr:aspartate aminotransferase family protein [Thalassoglobus neptunius]TWT57947.1 Acetylornithine aminotransferase [Thalassoglobus neptunius]
MQNPIQHPGENQSNETRARLTSSEPKSLRTYTPSQAVFSKSAGVFHWTPEGRRLYDFSSGVLVANLGHNPTRWLKRLTSYLGWNLNEIETSEEPYLAAVPLTAYNAMTELEAEANDRLRKSLQRSSGGEFLDHVLWSASGSEAVQKALWACLERDPKRQRILATRHGFHGKKGLAGAVTGCETDRDRDPRVTFVSFPMASCDDLEQPSEEFDFQEYEQELNSLWNEYGNEINCLITEPYLGGGGSFHPPKEYLQRLQKWCNEHDILFILDEVQANFGRTGEMYAFEAYGLRPDFVCLGKGLGNGVPVSAAVGRSEITKHMNYGAASDTWSANPFSCAAVLATLDEFESTEIVENTRMIGKLFADRLIQAKASPLIAKVRGEGLVFGVECDAYAGFTPAEVANEIVKQCYLGDESGNGIHLLGALAGKVLRVSPPMSMTREEAELSLDLFDAILERTAESLENGRQSASSSVSCSQGG